MTCRRQGPAIRQADLFVDQLIVQLTEIARRYGLRMNGQAHARHQKIIRTLFMLMRNILSIKDIFNNLVAPEKLKFNDKIIQGNNCSALLTDSSLPTSINLELLWSKPLIVCFTQGQGKHHHGEFASLCISGKIRGK